MIAATFAACTVIALAFVAVVMLAPKTPPHLRNRAPYRNPTFPPGANRDA